MSDIFVFFGFDANNHPKFFVLPTKARVKFGDELTWHLIGPKGATFAPAIGVEWDTLDGVGAFNDGVNNTWTLKVTSPNKGKDPIAYKYTIHVLDTDKSPYSFGDDPEIVNDPSGGGGEPG